MFKQIALIAALAFSTGAFAEGPTCQAQAGEKKLAGAAKSSFEKKCVKDAVGG